MTGKHFPDHFAPVYRNMKSNQVVSKGDPVPRRKPRKTPANDLIDHYTGKCAVHIHGCKVKWNGGFLLNGLACVGTGKVAYVECIMHSSGTCVHDKQHPIGRLTGNSLKEERKKVSLSISLCFISFMKECCFNFIDKLIFTSSLISSSSALEMQPLNFLTTCTRISLMQKTTVELQVHWDRTLSCAENWPFRRGRSWE